MHFWLWLVLQVVVPIGLAVCLWTCWGRYKRARGRQTAVDIVCEAVTTLDLPGLHYALECFPRFNASLFRTQEGWSLLHLAICKSEGLDPKLPEMCYYLVENCFLDVDSFDNPRALSAVHLAIAYGKEDTAVYLLTELGASFSQQSKSGANAGNWAAACGFVHVLETIVDLGGLSTLFVPNGQKYNCLEVALEKKQFSCIAFLLRAGVRCSPVYPLRSVFESKESQVFITAATEELGALSVRLRALESVLLEHMNADVLTMIQDYSNTLTFEEALFFLTTE